METFFVMGKNVLLFVALALPGFFLVKGKILKEEHSGILSLFLMKIAFPMMIFHGTVTKIQLTGATFGSVATGAVIALLGLSLSALLAVLLTGGIRDEKRRGMMRFCANIPNNGFLGIPLGLAVFGGDSPVMAPLISINIITTVFLYTVGIYFVSGDKGAISPKKALLSPALLSFVAGIVVNLSGLGELVPEIGTFAGHFSAMVTPLSMTVLGMKMAAAGWKRVFTGGHLPAVSLMKLILFPAVVLGLLLCLRPLLPSILTREIMLAAFVSFAMPTAGLAPTLADTYGGSVDEAVSATMGTTLLSIATIPLLYLGFTFLI